jgi:hypothetical protein
MQITAVCAQERRLSLMKQYDTSSSVMPVYCLISAFSEGCAPCFHHPTAV